MKGVLFTDYFAHFSETSSDVSAQIFVMIAKSKKMIAKDVILR